MQKKCPKNALFDNPVVGRSGEGNQVEKWGVGKEFKLVTTLFVHPCKKNPKMQTLATGVTDAEFKERGQLYSKLFFRQNDGLLGLIIRLCGNVHFPYV